MKEQKSHSRRKILKTATIAGVAVTSEIVLPGGWVKPVAEFFVSPAHAQTSAPPEEVPPEEVPIDGPDTPSSPPPEPPAPAPPPTGSEGTTYSGPIALYNQSGMIGTAPFVATTCVNVESGNFVVDARVNSQNTPRYRGDGTGPLIIMDLVDGAGPLTMQAQVSFSSSFPDKIFVGLAVGHYQGSDPLDERACL